MNNCIDSLKVRPSVRNFLMYWTLQAVLASPVLAQQSDENLDENEVQIQQVVALLGNQPITLAEVYYHLGRDWRSLDSAFSDPSSPLSRLVRENAVQLIASQNQALQTLRSLKLSAESDEVENWIVAHVYPEGFFESAETRTAAELVKTVADRARIPERVFWDQVEFRLAWQKYLAKHVNATNVARHYASQSSRFDGTRFRVWMVSLPAPAGDSKIRSQASMQLTAFAAKVEDVNDLRQVARLAREGNLEFTDATSVKGLGDLDSKVVDVLLDTGVGNLTEIVHTAGGVHLLGLLEKSSGDRGLEDVRAEVRMHMLEYLLEYLAAQSRQKMPLKAVVASTENS